MLVKETFGEYSICRVKIAEATLDLICLLERMENKHRIYWALVDTDNGY